MTTKVQFIELYQRGVFGNRAPTWNSYREWWEDWGEDGWEDRLYHIRNRVAGGPTWYDLDVDELEAKWREVGGPSYYISEMAPTELTTLQGEVRRSERGLELFYGTVKKPMRASLLDGGKHVGGIIAFELLRSYMDATSRDWLDYLLDEYEDHVVEFSCYERQWGTLPWNTVFWECRLY